MNQQRIFYTLNRIDCKRQAGCFCLFVLFGLTWLLSPQMAWAQSNGQRSGLVPQVVSLPAGPGSLEGLGESFQPNLSTGTASYAYPIIVPPAVHGFQPSLALIYDGGNPDGVWGLGWKLNLPYIQRQTDKGLPDYTLADRFIFHTGEELVPISDNVYRFENESSFLRFRWLADTESWQAHSPDGTLFEFGAEHDARLLVRNAGKKAIFRWSLNRQVDVHGNEIRYLYSRLDGGSYTYLTEIRYNFSNDEQYNHGQYNAVKFFYADRPDKFTDRSSGSAIASTLRAVHIDLFSLGKFVRRYQLEYAETTATSPHSLLNRITLIGDEENRQKLPPTTFTYTQLDPHAYAVVDMTHSPGAALQNPNVALLDMSYDGLPDVVYTPSNFQQYLYLNQGQGRWRADIRSGVGIARLDSPAIKIADMDGDGQADLLRQMSNTEIAYYATKPGELWSNRDYVPYAAWDSPYFNLSTGQVRLLDMNNDKYIDILELGTDAYHIWLAPHDNRWSAKPDRFVDVLSNGLPRDIDKVRFADMTGDRILDLVVISKEHFSYYPHNGAGDYDAERVLQDVPDWLSEDALHDLLLGDINHDGLADMIEPLSGLVRYWLNLGNDHFSKSYRIPAADDTTTHVPELRPGRTSVQLADMDGDGSLDLVYGQPSGEIQYVDFNQQSQPNLLASIDNGLGRLYKISYKPSTTDMVADADAGQAWQSTIPFPVQVVSRLVISDANSGNEYVTDYHYRNGYYDGIQKEFRGFAEVIETQHGDDSAPTTVTHDFYNVGDVQESRKGLLEAETILGEDGSCAPPRKDCYQQIINSLATYTITSGVTFSAITQTETLLYEKSDRPIQLLKRFAYDHYGNQTELLNYGQICPQADGSMDLACGNDELLKFTDYAINPERWLIHTPSIITQTDSTGQVVSLERFYYDGEPYVGLPLYSVVRGNLTRQEAAVDAQGKRFIPTKRQFFDSYGNVVGIMDANGHLTTIHYDDLSHTFPVAESIHLDAGRALTYTADYDIGFGKMISATEFNQNTTLFTYDPFGRIASIVQPGDTLELPTQRFSYDLGSPRSSITTQQREQSGTDNVHTSVVYFDGLGRKLQTRSEGEDGQVVVADAVTFNARQSEYEHFLPYFADGFVYTPPDTALPHSNKEYDPLHRIIRMVNPDASFASVEFQPLVQIQSDEEDNHRGSPYFGTPKTLRYDGLERLVEVVETNRVSDTIESYYTHYHYDPLGNLTQIIDDHGNSKTMQYDALSRKLFMDDPDRGEMHYVYDDAGNLIQTTDAKGQVIRHSYDAANRPLTEQWPQSDDTFRTVFTYHYDDDLSSLHTDARNTLGQVTYIEDPEGALYFSYDERGNVAGRIRSFTQEGLSFVTRMRYDAMNRLSELTYPDGYTITYGYNDQGLLEAIPGYVNNIDYTPSGQRNAIAYANGITTHYDYDIRLRLKHLQSNSLRNVLQDLDYKFDQVSNIVSIADSRPSGIRIDANDQTQMFHYDSLYRLTQANGKYGEIDYAYDSIDNMIHQNSTIDDPRLHLDEMRYGVDKAGPHALSFAGGNHYSYDDNGNQLGTATISYTWNVRDWLVETRSEDTTSRYSYDSIGQRVQQTVSKGNTITTTLYIDQYAEMRDGQFIRYVFDNQQRIAQIKTGIDATTLWYIADHLSGTSLTMDANGQMISELAYYPYGLTRFDINGNNTYFQFTGKELDSSGLYYYGSRYYDPILARFVSADPSTLMGTLPYLYANGNPLRFVDPTGRDAQNRVDAARKMIGTPYKQQSENALRTENTPEALQYLDCSELVSRVLADDHLTEGVKPMSTKELQTLLEDDSKFIYSANEPKVGDIALWRGPKNGDLNKIEGHVGIVSAVEGDKFKLIHAANVAKGTIENPNLTTASGYRKDIQFYGFYRPINESINGKDSASNTPQIPRDPFEPQVRNSTVSHE